MSRAKKQQVMAYVLFQLLQHSCHLVKTYLLQCRLDARMACVVLVSQALLNLTARLSHHHDPRTSNIRLDCWMENVILQT